MWLYCFKKKTKKPINIESQTSFPEQAIFYYISKLETAENRYKFHNKELDIFLPNLKVGIEYDGEYYHRSEKAKAREAEKDTYLNKFGIRVIRIKESDYNDVVNNIIYCKADNKYAYLKYVIMSLLTMLSLSSDSFDVNIRRDSLEIYNLYIKIQKEKSLASKFPSIAAEWDLEKNKGLSPDTISCGTHMKVWWKCLRGHSWKAAVYSRLKHGCPYCSGAMLIRGENEFQTQNPVLSKEWDYEKNGLLKPSDITVNNGKKVWWKCSVCGYSWESSPAHRTAGRGCPECAKVKGSDAFCQTRIKNVGSLADTYPQLAEEWNYTKNVKYSPDSVTPHSGRKVWWKCSKCENEWEAFISNRAKGSGCPRCKQQQREQSFTNRAVKKTGSLKETHPQLAKEWDVEKNGNFKSSDISFGTNKKAW